LTSSLPPEVLALAQFHPVEDLILALLRDGLPEAIHVNSLVADGQEWPLVLVRRGLDWGFWAGDPRGFIDSGTLAISVFCDGLEADSDAAYLSEAVRVILHRSVNKVVSGLGYLTEVDLDNAPHRVTDWASATGPVQFADLPTGVMRYETTYSLGIRAPRT